MLIVVDGIHGGGKSTLINSLAKHLQANGHEVVLTSWNSYDAVHPTIYHLRKNGLLHDPTLFFLMQLTDFAFRHEHVILPALHEGKVVVADRYVYTGMVRGLIRGLSEDYVKTLYSFAVKPDLTIMLDLSSEESLKRTVPKSNATWYIGFGQPHPSEDSLDLEGYGAYLNQLRRMYKKLATAPEDVVLSASLSQDELLEQVLDQKIIREYLVI